MRRPAAITRASLRLKAPLQSAGGVTALILTHGDRQAALWVRRDAVRIARKAGAFSYDGCALGGRIGIREANGIVEDRANRGQWGPAKVAGGPVNSSSPSWLAWALLRAAALDLVRMSTDIPDEVHPRVENSDYHDAGRRRLEDNICEPTENLR
jgi:hypothetical protein